MVCSPLFLGSLPCPTCGNANTTMQIKMNMKVRQEKNAKDKWLFSKSAFNGKALNLTRILKNLDTGLIFSLALDPIGWTLCLSFDTIILLLHSRTVPCTVPFSIILHQYPTISSTHAAIGSWFITCMLFGTEKIKLRTKEVVNSLLHYYNLSTNMLPIFPQVTH